MPQFTLCGSVKLWKHTDILTGVPFPWKLRMSQVWVRSVTALNEQDSRDLDIGLRDKKGLTNAYVHRNHKGLKPVLHPIPSTWAGSVIPMKIPDASLIFFVMYVTKFKCLWTKLILTIMILMLGEECRLIWFGVFTFDCICLWESTYQAVIL